MLVCVDNFIVSSPAETCAIQVAESLADEVLDIFKRLLSCLSFIQNHHVCQDEIIKNSLAALLLHNYFKADSSRNFSKSVAQVIIWNLNSACDSDSIFILIQGIISLYGETLANFVVGNKVRQNGCSDDFLVAAGKVLYKAVYTTNSCWSGHRVRQGRLYHRASNFCNLAWINSDSKSCNCLHIGEVL